MNKGRVVQEKLPPLVYKDLEAIVGAEWISDDRAVVEGYSRGLFAPEVIPKHMRDRSVLPACIVLPATTEEVEAIVKVCNRNGISMVAVTNGQLGTTPTSPGTLILHFSRMDRILEINEENMTATLQPYVGYHQLQAETMKRGLWNGGCPLATAITKLSSQFNSAGVWQTDLKYGAFNRNIVSVKMVLSDGEILVTGSAGQAGADNFWEYSPGPDLIGFARGSFGTMGFITEITVKLHTWIGETALPEDIGHPSIETYYEDTAKKRFDRPSVPKGHSIHWLEFPDYESELDALYKISRAGIGIGLNAAGVYSAYYCSQTSELTNERYEKGFFPPWNCYVMLAGISSEKQLRYEQKVLDEIVRETNAKYLSESYRPEVLDVLAPWGLDCFRHVTGMRMCRGGYAILTAPVGPISMSVDHRESWLKALEIFGETHMTDRGGADSTPFIYVVNRGHFVYVESDTYPQTHSALEGLQKSMALMIYSWAKSVKDKQSGSIVIGLNMEPFHSFFPETGPNSNLLYRKVRKVFDPNSIYAPGRLVYTEEELERVPESVKGPIMEIRKMVGLKDDISPVSDA